MAHKEIEDDDQSNQYLADFYKTYPQLVPFSTLNMRFNLKVLNDGLSKEEEQVIYGLKRCNINWEEVISDEWPTIQLLFSEKDGKRQVEYKVISKEEPPNRSINGT